VYYGMLIAISLGFAGAIVFGLRASWAIVKRVRAIPFDTVPRKNLVTPFGVLGFIASAPFAIFLAIVIGGTVGGGYGEWLFSFLGVARFGPLVGVPVGIMLVFCVVACVGALLGSLLGRLVTYGFLSRPAP
jgi:hypothetical protein